MATGSPVVIIVIQNIFDKPELLFVECFICDAIKCILTEYKKM